MTAGSKLACLACLLFVSVLVVYYGPRPAQPERVDAVPAERATAPPQAHQQAPPAVKDEVVARHDERTTSSLVPGARTSVLDIQPDPIAKDEVRDPPDLGFGGHERPVDPVLPSPSPTTPDPRATARRTYTIQQDDTFSSIAEDLLGDAQLWTEIVRANPNVDPKRIRVGDVIRLPDGAARSDSNVRDRAPGRFHTVGDLETLSDIARMHYGDSSRWSDIWKANRAVIGSNPDVLELGMKLVIPN